MVLSLSVMRSSMKLLMLWRVMQDIPLRGFGDCVDRYPFAYGSLELPGMMWYSLRLLCDLR